MASDASKVRVGVSGAIYKGALGATAPTGTSGTPAGFTDMGYVSEDGVEVTIPGSGDSTPIKAWQEGTTVRTVRSPSEDNPSWHFTLLETSIDVVELYFGVEVTSSASEGNFKYAVADRDPQAFVIDVVDGAELIRDYLPRGVVTEVGAQTFSNGEPIGYEVTIEADYDAGLAANFQRWATALKTPA